MEKPGCEQQELCGSRRGMTGNCVGQRNRPSRQLEVPEEGFGEVIKLISSPTHSPGGTGLALRCR